MRDTTMARPFKLHNLHRVVSFETFDSAVSKAQTLATQYNRPWDVIDTQTNSIHSVQPTWLTDECRADLNSQPIGWDLQQSESHQTQRATIAGQVIDARIGSFAEALGFSSPSALLEWVRNRENAAERAFENYGVQVWRTPDGTAVSYVQFGVHSWAQAFAHHARSRRMTAVIETSPNDWEPSLGGRPNFEVHLSDRRGNPVTFDSCCLLFQDVKSGFLKGTPQEITDYACREHLFNASDYLADAEGYHLNRCLERYRAAVTADVSQYNDSQIERLFANVSAGIEGVRSYLGHARQYWGYARACTLSDDDRETMEVLVADGEARIVWVESILQRMEGEIEPMHQTLRERREEKERKEREAREREEKRIKARAERIAKARAEGRFYFKRTGKALSPLCNVETFHQTLANWWRNVSGQSTRAFPKVPTRHSLIGMFGPMGVRKSRQWKKGSKRIDGYVWGENDPSALMLNRYVVNSCHHIEHGGWRVGNYAWIYCPFWFAMFAGKQDGTVMKVAHENVVQINGEDALIRKHASTCNALLMCDTDNRPYLYLSKPYCSSPESPWFPHIVRYARILCRKLGIGLVIDSDYACQANLPNRNAYENVYVQTPEFPMPFSSYEGYQDGNINWTYRTNGNWTVKGYGKCVLEPVVDSIEGMEQSIAKETYAPEDDETVSCCACGDRLHMDDSYSNDHGDTYCHACYSDRYTSCYRCSDETNVNEASEGADGNSYCEYCWNERFTHCENCNETVDICATHEAPNGQEYCDSCFDAECSHCDECGTAVWNDEAETVEETFTTHTCCEDCANRLREEIAAQQAAEERNAREQVQPPLPFDPSFVPVSMLWGTAHRQNATVTRVQTQEGPSDPYVRQWVNRPLSRAFDPCAVADAWARVQAVRECSIIVSQIEFAHNAIHA
jgi:hypothetical protein